jgi:hypothetical protein
MCPSELGSNHHEQIPVIVETPDGNSITLDVKSNEIVGHVKALIHVKVKIDTFSHLRCFLDRNLSCPTDPDL